MTADQIRQDALKNAPHTHPASLCSMHRDPVEMTPGTVINIPADVKHWHGAAPDSWFSHLAIEVALCPVS